MLDNTPASYNTLCFRKNFLEKIKKNNNAKLRIRLEMKNHNMIFSEKLQKDQLYYQVTFINMNILVELLIRVER